MPEKKSDKPDKSPKDDELVKRVDDMMNIKGSDVSQLAEDFNKKFMTAKVKVTDAPSTSVTSAPELPGHLHVKDEPQAVKEQPPVKPDEPDDPDTPDILAEQPEIKNEDQLADDRTDAAVDDIAAHESDALLAVEDADKEREAKRAETDKKGWQDKFSSFFKNKKTWAGVVILLLVLLGVPATRYKILGLVIKKSVTVTVLDSKTAGPVSGAEVQLAGAASKTDADGKVTLKAPLGSQQLSVAKQYYAKLDKDYFVGFKSSGQSNLKLVATGRLVPIKVLNKITGKALAGVTVKSLNTSTKTNAKGVASIALPVKHDTEKGTVTLTGYNAAEVTIRITDEVIKENSFELTPAGKIYFLSNKNGTLDVVKSNLDGSERKVVLEGTGKEEAAATSLLASRDWRYLALKSRRENNQAALYLIDTKSDKITSIDTNDADFNLIGWHNHSFIYSMTRNTYKDWQPGRQAIKSYDAENLQLNQLDQNQAEGSDSSAYAYQNFANFYIVDGLVAYSTQWYSYNTDNASKNDTIRAVQPNGQNKKDYQSFPTAKTAYIQAALYAPQEIYYSVYDNSIGKPTFYEFEAQSVKTASIDQNKFEEKYPTFLLSPTGLKTFWSELRDGKNTLFTGDKNAAAKKQIADSSDYAPYGWYSENYLLVSKNSSELYVIPATGLLSGRQPVKITDYYKPAKTYAGYGYGYGGL